MRGHILGLYGWFMQFIDLLQNRQITIWNGVGSIIVQLVCFTSGMYFSKDLIGNGFAKLCELLPFESALNIIKGVLNNNYDILSTRNIIVFVAYTIIILILSIIVFKRKMIGDNK